MITIVSKLVDDLTGLVHVTTRETIRSATGQEHVINGLYVIDEDAGEVGPAWTNEDIEVFLAGKFNLPRTSVRTVERSVRPSRDSEVPEPTPMVPASEIEP